MFRLRDYYAPDFTASKFTSCPDAILRPVENDTVAPDNYHAMSIYPEYFRIVTRHYQNPFRAVSEIRF